MFHDVFSQIRRKERLKPPPVNDPLDSHRLSFVFMVLDSVSRTQFLRHMPKTIEFMNEHNFQILNMYNKVSPFIEK